MLNTARQTRVVVVGAGAVGAATAYTLLLRRRADEIVLIDSKADKANGEALDMQHGHVFLDGVKVWSGDYGDCAGADIIIITAGVAQKPGETRQDLLTRNSEILRDITHEVTRHNQSGVLVVATNPVDVLSYLAWKETGWPSTRVIGSGTVLDSARLRFLLGLELATDPNGIDALVIGEHGDSQVPVWSTLCVAGRPVRLPYARQEFISAQTRDAAYEVIRSKGCTNFAIALALDRICEAILEDQHAILNVSTLVTDYHGISNVYLSVPCVIGRSGIEQVADLNLIPEESLRLQQSANLLSRQIDTVLQVPSSRILYSS